MKKTKSSALPKKPLTTSKIVITDTDLPASLPILSPKHNSKLKPLTLNPQQQQIDSRLFIQSQVLSARSHQEDPADTLKRSLLGSPPSVARTFKSIKLSLPPRSRVVLPALPLFKNVKEEDETPLFKNRLRTPLHQEKVISGDENPNDRSPKSGATEFYSHYKNLDKIRDINEFNQTKDALFTNFLRKSENLNLLPSKIGFIASDKTSNNRIKLNHYRLGDKKAAVLSEGLKTAANGFNRFELSHNRLTSSGAELILSTLTNKTEVINLSGNSIGKVGCEHLSKILKFKYPRLQELNLEGNKLGDSAIPGLLDALMDNDTLTKLNLNKNLLTNTGAKAIANMIEQNSSIEELYLSWNQIKSQGGTAIFDAMAKKPHIRVLDLSWNSLGLYDSPFATNFAAFISRDEFLAHLDLSNNSFSKKSALIIAEALKSNHSLYGFHFQGNFGYVDAKGFLVVADDYAQDLTVQMLSPQVKGTKIQFESIKRHQNQHCEDYQDVCWICEGWRPVEIQWNPESSGIGSEDPIYVHLSYEGYQGRFISRNKEFRTVRMAPPTKFNYLFSVDDQQTHAEDHLIEDIDPSNSQIKIMKDGNKKALKVEFLNKFDAVKPHTVLDEDFRPVEELVDLGIKPRIADEIYIPPEILTARPEWKFAVSIFKDYKVDSQALLDRCFEVDFEGTRIAKIVKNEEDLKAVRETLHKVYKNLKECYKYYAAIGAPSEIWSIPMNTYTEFCSSAGVIDGKILKLSDFDRIFIATYTRTEKEKNSRNPDRALVRYQFMEGLVRIADQKYLGTGLTNNYKDALKQLLDDNLGAFLSKFDHQKWRVEKYWNEAVDTVLKSYLPILKGAYKKNIGLRTLPGQRKFMCLEEFHRLMGDCGIFNDNLGDRDATLAFSLSMMTQTDELQSDRIYQMQFLEFLEAFARVADKYSASPYGTNDAEMTYEERLKQPLHIKIEGLMQRLFEASGAETKEVWILPETSIFNMEEVHGKQRFATKKKKIMRIDPTESSSSDPYDC